MLTRHVYAGIETLEEHVCCDVSAPGGQCAAPSGFALAREFVWGDRFPEPLAMIDHTDAGDIPATGQPGGGPEVLHYLHDTLGSVVALADASGQVVERYTYEPYGETIIEQTDPATGQPLRDPQTGQPTGRLSASRYGNPFGWTVQRYDAGVGLYHFLFRSYSPHLGRWLQRDPLGYVGDISLYQYLVSMPTYWIDPDGLGPCDKLRKKLGELQAQRSKTLGTIAHHEATILALKSKIANLHRKILQRERDLRRNPRGLPESAPGDDKNPRLSRRGHRRLIAQDRAALRRAERRLRKQEQDLNRAKSKLATLNAEIASVTAALAACEKAEKEAKKKTAKKVAKKIAKKGVKTAASKLPIVGVCFFVYDWHEGGFCYAVNEACWPVSELWNLTSRFVA